MNIDEKIISLMRQLYKMSELEIKEFKIILNWFTEQEKIDIAHILWEKLQEEESIFKKLFKKLRWIKNEVKELKTKKEADNLLLNL